MNKNTGTKMARIYAAFGKNVTKVRGAVGKTQQQLSEETGLSLRMIQYIERGSCDCDLCSAEKIAEACHVPLAALYKGL